MFEKEAEENKPPYVCCSFNTGCELWKDGFQKGADFGYNKAKIEVEESYKESLCNSELNLAHVTEELEELEKAKEWHYVKDGEYPSKHLESYVVAFYGAKGSVAKGKPCWEELCWDAEFSRWVDRETFEDLPYVNTEGIVIAWKEIVFPKESK